ncbi:Zinc finger RING-type [Arabidopsis thaliana x Arabidopsis arenosa]|uniref:RING-type E3 ubiquitin transferase n=1 Tax=Arabidopsis thaliana x Arabidopsis arenosa TaxID=1240361 RepID=A0A8T1ZSV7_9BRAS|nr:Zinc finger RING-type [Arabidopsis thaliana x Arabidopsis arenosa]
MDDSCAVCADNLEWVAYGSCGHREVCSTCVVRLRFVLDDPRCCICKTESPIVFVTKALGDYTRTITDFSTFPSAPREGRVGAFWYHEDTQAFFDDLDHYRMIKAMCRLSCGVCDKAEDQPREGGPRHHRQRIKSVEQLKGHLYHKHKLHMCGLCLEGRKIFICEQKLYTRAQLNQHIHTGDSEVDGSESERGGFAGHPMCEFCRNPFYGDNELYTHMSTEHYTCHLCQRSQPGQYEYYKNYDDLEIHFRRDHFLCEDDSCLAKKFTVFQNESELKRHNAIEHGGKMSRSQRSAALQIPTSFRYRRGNDQENRRGRPRSFRREPGDDEYNLAVHAALRLSEAEYSRQEPAPPPSSAPPGFSENNNIHVDDADPLILPMESLSTTDMEPSSRYLQAVGSSGGGGTRLGESAFPPLSGQPRSGQNVESLPTNTMAARLRRQTNRTTTASAIASPSQGWPVVNRGPAQASITSGGNHSSSGWPAIGRTPVQASSSSVQSMSHTRVSQARPLAPAVSQVARNANRIPHSSSAPNLSDTRSLQPSHSDFPPVSSAVVQNRKTSSTTTHGSSNTQPPPDVQSANKSLIEKMRSALGHDEDVFVAFRNISGQYRQGLIDAKTYLEYVKGYGLAHLVIDLARLCPDPKRQKDLIDTHNASLREEDSKENGRAAAQSSSQPKDSQSSKKNKGKAVKVADPKETLADNFMDTVRRLQSSQNPQEEEETISKDKNSYRSDKGKSQVAGADSSSTGNKQQRKKTSKFHRVRLGDGSMAALLDLNNSNREPEQESKDDNSNSNQNQTGGLPVRGVWRKGGANLFS